MNTDEPTRRSFSAERFARKTILFAYGLLILSVFRNDAVGHFIDREYQFLVVFAAIALMALSVGYSALGRWDERRKSSIIIAALKFPLFVLLLLPPVWGLLRPPVVLLGSEDVFGQMIGFSSASRDPDVFKNRGPGDAEVKAPADDGSGRMIKKWYTPLNILELGILVQRNSNAYVGDRVGLRGYVVHSDELPPNHFRLYRSLVTCCTKHTIGIYVTVEAPGASSIKEGQWASVFGTIQKEKKHREHGHEREKSRRRHEKGKHVDENTGVSVVIMAERIFTTGVPPETSIEKWSARKPFHF